MKKHANPPNRRKMNISITNFSVDCNIVMIVKKEKFIINVTISIQFHKSLK